MKAILLIITLYISSALFAQQHISAVRSQIGSEVTVSGIVTNGSELGRIRYFQDETAGLAAYGDSAEQLKRGDSITISGTLKDYNNLLEIDPVSSVTIHVSNRTLPSPKIISAEKIGEQYEGQLVRINNVRISGTAGTFAGNQNYTFTAGSASGELRIDDDSPIAGEIIPTKPFDLVAIVSQYSRDNSNTGYQLLPRDMNDIILTQAVNFTSPAEVAAISKNGITLRWTTDVRASTEIRYGSTLNKAAWLYKKSGEPVPSGDEFLHQISISGYEPATVFYAEAFSVAFGDTAFSSAGVYATQSNSSGAIRAYFNTAVDHSVANGIPATNIGTAMEDTLIAYIDRAQGTIDFCIYNINNWQLSNVSYALNDAHSRGVQIRVITDGTTNHLGVSDLDDNIPVLVRPSEQDGGIMHNKFAVIDADSDNPDVPWLWTGSANISFYQINSDANNSVFIQDQTLAKAYQMEFEEMWGSSELLPDSDNAKFGVEKTDNTPHHFIVGESSVESYFSPSDNTNQKIIQALKTADNDLNVETMLITRTDLANTISEIAQSGTEVQVIIDEEYNNFESVNILKNNLPAGKFIFDDGVEGLLHHKVAIIDAFAPDSDPQVITGSHNWSNAANDRNDENTLIIHSAEIANIYFQQFAHRFRANGGSLYVTANQNNIPKLNVYPNPFTAELQIQAEKELSMIEVYTVSGTKIYSAKKVDSITHTINMHKRPSGAYLLMVVFKDDKKYSTVILKK